MLKIVIAGVGGIGMNLAISLAQIEKINDKQIDHLCLIDPDIVEKKNLNRLPMKKYIDKPKTHALLQFINENIRRDHLNISVYMGDARKYITHIVSPISMFDNTILIDCTDRTFIQKDLIEISRTKKFQYMRIGNENNIVTIEINKNYAESLEKHVMGYESTPTNPFYVGGALSIAYYHLSNIIENITNRDIKILKLSYTYDLDQYEKLNHIYNSL